MTQRVIGSVDPKSDRLEHEARTATLADLETLYRRLKKADSERSAAFTMLVRISDAGRTVKIRDKAERYWRRFMGRRMVT